MLTLPFEKVKPTDLFVFRGDLELGFGRAGLREKGFTRLHRFRMQSDSSASLRTEWIANAEGRGYEQSRQCALVCEIQALPLSHFLCLTPRNDLPLDLSRASQ